MDVDAGEAGAGPEPMTIDRVDVGQEREGSDEEEGDTRLNNLILQTQADMWNTFCYVLTARLKHEACSCRATATAIPALSQARSRSSSAPGGMDTGSSTEAEAIPDWK